MKNSSFNILRKFTFLNLSFVIILALFTLSACKEENSTSPDPTDLSLVKLASTQNSDVKVELYGKEEFEVGYNYVHVKLMDASTGTVIKNAKVTLSCIMDMSDHHHYSPIEQPQSETISGTMFPAAVIFSMGDDHGGTWNINVHYKLPSGKEADLKMPVTVEDEENVVSFSYNNENYLVTMLCMCDANVGINDIEFVVHKELDEEGNFQAIDSLTMDMDVLMTSMGHGSPNNIAPVNTGKGHYYGKINFTMTGEWRATLTLRKGMDTLGKAVFNMPIPGKDHHH